MELHLWFTEDASEPSLFKTRFVRASGDTEIECIRGSSELKCFKWSAAVHALCILLVKHAANAAAAPSTSICGDRGTPAASLDFSISKQPNWLLDMFGLERTGEPTMRRIFSRINPERKYPGDVTILVRKVLAPDAISVYLSERKLSGESINTLLSSLEERWKSVPNGFGRKARPGSSDSVTSALTDTLAPFPTAQKFVAEQSRLGGLGYPFDQSESKKRLVDMIYEEAVEVLRGTQVLHQDALTETIRKLTDNRTLKRLAGGNFRMFESLGRRGLTRYDMGIVHRKHFTASLLQEESELSVVAVPTQVGSLSILKFLELFEDLPVRVDFCFAHSLEIIEALRLGALSHEPSLCVLAVGSTARLFGALESSNYVPVVFMPKVTHAVVFSRNSAATKASLATGEYFFVTDEGSSNFYYYSELAAQEQFTLRRVCLRNAEANEALLALASGEKHIKSIQPFPHYRFNDMFSETSSLRLPTMNRFEQEGVLLAHRRIVEDPQKSDLLRGTILNAWHELAASNDLLRAVVSVLCEDRMFTKSLTRYGGLSRLFPPARSSEPPPTVIRPD